MGERKNFLNSTCSPTMRNTLSSVGSEIGKKKWPDHWRDGQHEEDGGEGSGHLREEISKLDGQGNQWRAIDDVSGADLDPALVRQARRLEMGCSHDMGGCTKRCRGR